MTASIGKKIVSGVTARAMIMEGVNELADVVSSTFGPKGRNVLMDKGGIEPVSTKDGVSVANDIDFSNPYKRMGAQLIREVARKVDSEAGDGTTTSTVYCHKLINTANKMVALGFEASELKKGINTASNIAIQWMKENASPAKDLMSIAMTAANRDEAIAKVVVEGFEKLGDNGVVSIVESYKKDGSHYVEHTDGLKFRGGIASSDYSHSPTGEVVLPKPLVLTLAFVPDKIDDFLSYKDIAATKNRPLVLIAPYFKGDFIAQALVNNIFCIKSPGGDSNIEELTAILSDLAFMLGTTIVPNVKVMPTVIKSFKDFGSADMIKTEPSSTEIMQDSEMPEEKLTKLLEYIESLKAAINSDEHISSSHLEFMKDRLARMSGGISLIHIGGLTKPEKQANIHQAEDTVNSVRSAIDNGILPGGGTAMLRCAKHLAIIKKEAQAINKLSDEAMKGYEAVISALREPALKLARSVDPNNYQLIVSKVEADTHFFNGFNAVTEQIENLEEAGVVDSAAIEINAIRYSSSTVQTFITTEYVIVNENQNVNYDYVDRAVVEAE